jgi:hypothetical protein
MDVDINHMTPAAAEQEDQRQGAEIEFFGVQLKVHNPRLAELLNSSVNDDVEVIARRARDVLAVPNDERAELDVEQRVLDADDSVVIRLDEPEDD